MEDIVRSSDLTDAMRKIKALDNKLNTATADAANWKLYVAGGIKNTVDGLALELSIAKNNGHGFITTVSSADAEYYANDPEGLVAELTQEVFEKLYKEQIRNELTQIVSRGLRNVKMMKDKV